MVEDLAKTAARANASGGTCVASPKAAHMATAAYGLQAARKPMHTATDSCGEEAVAHVQRTTGPGVKLLPVCWQYDILYMCTPDLIPSWCFGSQSDSVTINLWQLARKAIIKPKHTYQESTNVTNDWTKLAVPLFCHSSTMHTLREYVLNRWPQQNRQVFNSVWFSYEQQHWT